MQGKWKWYISIAAVKEWMRITGRAGPLEDNNPAFLAAQNELGDMSLTATPTQAHALYPGQEIWRTKVTLYGSRHRIDCTIATAKREEGSLPQLVWVTDKGVSKHKNRQRRPPTPTTPPVEPKSLSTKGHWPKGKRRHTDAGDWMQVRLGLTSLLDEHGEPGLVSLRAIGQAVGTDGRTVHKWLTDVNRPSPERQGLLRAWLREQRRRIERQKATASL